MTPTSGSDYYAGQVQLMTVTGKYGTKIPEIMCCPLTPGEPSRHNPVFHPNVAKQLFPGGSGPVINASINEQLNAPGACGRHLSVNLGTLTRASAAGATWQLNFAINASQWGGVGPTDVLTIDNLVLTHLNKGLSVISSGNPSAYAAAVTFTATVVTNGVTEANATGTVVFSSAAGTFSTNAVTNGSATSTALTNLPVGANTITAIYAGGNYPAATNTMTQMVNAPAYPGVAQSGLSLYTDNSRERVSELELGHREFASPATRRCIPAITPSP